MTRAFYASVLRTARNCASRENARVRRRRLPRGRDHGPLGSRRRAELAHASRLATFLAKRNFSNYGLVGNDAPETYLYKLAALEISRAEGSINASAGGEAVARPYTPQHLGSVPRLQ
jgi:hypothetical protein